PGLRQPGPGRLSAPRPRGDGARPAASRDSEGAAGAGRALLEAPSLHPQGLVAHPPPMGYRRFIEAGTVGLLRHARSTVSDSGFNGIRRVPPPVNEPVKAYGPGSPEKTELKARLKAMAGERLDIPPVIGGKE